MANPFVMLNDEVQEALTLDSKEFLQSYHTKGTVSFTVFRELWEEFGMVRLHYCRPSLVDQDIYTEALYYTFTSYLYLDQTLDVRAAVLYSLYTLYHTQPSTPRVPIRLSPVVWRVLSKLNEDAWEDHAIPWVAKCFYELRKNKAFVFCVAVPTLPSVQQAAQPHKGLDPKEVDIKSGVNLVDTGKLRAAAQRYVTAKQTAIKAAQTAIGPQDSAYSRLHAGEVDRVVRQLDERQRAWSNKVNPPPPPPPPLSSEAAEDDEELRRRVSQLTTESPVSTATAVVLPVGKSPSPSSLIYRSRTPTEIAQQASTMTEPSDDVVMQEIQVLPSNHQQMFGLVSSALQLSLISSNHTAGDALASASRPTALHHPAPQPN